MSIYDFSPTNFSNIKTYELASRPSKVTVKDFASPIRKEDSLVEFLYKHSNVLAVKLIKKVAASIKRARDLGKPIIWGIGGHVVKTGLSPILIDLMRHGYLTTVATNGSVLVHDVEIALAGFTSEDVDATLEKGDFGAARETGEILNRAASRGQKEGLGLGEAMCREVLEKEPKYSNYSLLYQSYKNAILVTSHLTIGADIGHFHALADGSALGETSHTDFRLFCSVVREMNEGGIYLNYGSAVTLPEIFLKAIAVNRNLGHEVKNITTANFDFVQHYRPTTNVVHRPTANGAGKGFAITGHHELTLPLLAAFILCDAG